MALSRKYAALPDLDSAPDIYETPELTDDNSTIPGTTVRSASDNEFDDDVDGAGISRTRLRIDEARSRFMPASVDARDVDFSDRLTAKRKSYKASSRRQRILEDGTEEYGELSDEEEGESLERKLARLKREIEEAKEEYGRRKAAAKDSAAEEHRENEFATLSQALDEITLPPPGLLRSRPAAQVASRPASGVVRAKDAVPSGTALPGEAITYSVTYAPTFEQTHALAKAADFDRRLLLLEKALGIGSSAVAELDSNGLPRAILPTLDGLRKEISTLSQASTSSLDSISRRVRALAQEAENLEKARRNAKAAREALASTGTPIAEAAASQPGTAQAASSAEDTEQMAAKINALYGTLPTIESLAPLLPPLLDRLRSLRALHAEAASASETIERVEKRQADMASELQQWRAALEKVEEAMQEGEQAMQGNMKVVEGWVKDLEAKVAKLG
ncbi:hypothetical protein VTK73DRAFT_8295 [Phialemonium thermophilum]|uniref:Dynactin subunit n=1 Tax=Phialemonium thermophilum TaxID=223376 RepID=A0ABR3W969_9PEZI